MNLNSTKPHEALLKSLQKATTFEEVCNLLYCAIQNDSLDDHKSLYDFLSKNQEAIDAIHRFSGHEKFHEALWTVIHDEPSDLTALSEMPVTLNFTKKSNQPNQSKAIVPIKTSYYPAIIETSHYPMVIKNRNR